MLATKPARPDTQSLPWGILAVEALAIFLSVFLAFGVSAWWESREDASKARTALASFQDEIIQNRARVREAIPYHRELGANLGRLISEASQEDVFAGLREVGWRGTQPIRFQRTAWLAAEATGAFPLLDLETAGLISGIYAFQAELEQLQLGFFTHTILDTSTLAEAQPFFTILVIYLELVREYEEQLLHAYDGALSRLSSLTGLPIPTD